MRQENLRLTVFVLVIVFILTLGLSVQVYRSYSDEKVPVSATSVSSDAYFR